MSTKKRFILFIFIILFIPLVALNKYTLNNLGKFFFLTLHNNNFAEKLLLHSTQLNKQDEGGWFLLGRVQFVQNNLQDSVISYTKAKDLNPENEQIYYGLGLDYGYMGPLYYDLAAENFQMYLDIIDQKLKDGRYSAPPSGHWAGYNDLAWVYFLQGNYGKCESTARLGLSKYTNPWLLNMLGACLLNQERKEEAKKYFLQAQQYASNMTSEQFGEAYTGDNKEWHAKGFANMKKVIEENIEKANNPHKIP